MTTSDADASVGVGASAAVCADARAAAGLVNWQAREQSLDTPGREAADFGVAGLGTVAGLDTAFGRDTALGLDTVFGQWPDLESGGSAVGDQARQRRQGRAPAARLGRAVTVVQQHSGSRPQIGPQGPQDRLGGGVPGPVAAPGGPQHRPQAAAPGRGPATAGQDAVRRAVPADGSAGGCLDGGAGAAEFGELAGVAREPRAPMRPTVHGDLVATRRDLAHQPMVRRHVLTEHEERRAHAQPIQCGQESRRGRGIGSVVEGEGDVCQRATAGQRREQCAADSGQPGARRNDVRGDTGEAGGQTSHGQRVTSSAGHVSHGLAVYPEHAAINRALRILIVDADMGAGHRAVSDELAQRLRARGHDVRRLDILTTLPVGIGTALRASYRAMVRQTPWLYDAIYSGFLDTKRGPGSTPLAAVADHRLREAVHTYRPHLIVSVFHLAAQAVGRMRQHGELDVPTAVMITDFAVHSQWLHPGNDLHLCVSPDAARQVQAALDRPAYAPGPVAPERFRKAAVRGNVVAGNTAGGSAVREGGVRDGAARELAWYSRLDAIGAGRPVVLVSTGSWGVASGLVDTATRLAERGYLPVLLCGRDERARARLSRVPGVQALGWINDLDGLMAAASALIDNAAGQTAVQALAAGLPVVGYRPIAGHGRQGVARMAQIGVTEFVRGADELVDALAWLTEPGNPAREARVRAGFDLFAADAADFLERAAARVPQSSQLLGSP